MVWRKRALAVDQASGLPCHVLVSQIITLSCVSGLVCRTSIVWLLLSRIIAYLVGRPNLFNMHSDMCRHVNSVMLMWHGLMRSFAGKDTCSRVSDVPHSICTLIVEVWVFKAQEKYNIYWYILQILLIRGHEEGQVQHGLSSPCCCQGYQYYGLNNFGGNRHSHRGHCK